MRDGEQECRLCGYPSRECVLIPIPLTSRPMSNPVCRDCIEEIAAMGAEDNKAPFYITVKVETKKLEAAVAEYVAARQKAGKPCYEEDVMHIVQQHVSFGDLKPQAKDDEG